MTPRASASNSSSRKRKARPTASAARSARPSSGGGRRVRLPSLRGGRRLLAVHRARRSFPTYLLRPLHVGMVLALIYLLFPMFKSWRNRITPLDWLCAAASLVRGRLHRLARAGVRRSRHRSRAHGLCRRPRADRAAAGSDAPLDRLDHAGRVAVLRRLRAARQHRPPAPWTHRGYDLRTPHRPPLHDARGHLRHHRRSLIEPHHPVHDLRRHACSTRAPESSSSTSRSRPWAASAMPPAAPSCCRRS